MSEPDNLNLQGLLLCSSAQMYPRETTGTVLEIVTNLEKALKKDNPLNF